MNKRPSLISLIRSGHALISIATLEEAHALLQVKEAAMDLRRPLWVWSVIRGVYTGLLEDADGAPGTENPAAALFHLARVREAALCCTLDLSPHLRDERTLRALRELVDSFEQGGQRTLVTIDHADDLPPTIASRTVRHDVPLPDEEELTELVTRTLRREHRASPVSIDLTKAQLQAIIRNLRGLTRRQAERLTVSLVAEDRRLDAEDLAATLAHKRHLLGAGGLLEFIETPAALEQIGGMRRLKVWLKHRECALSENAEEFGLAAPRGVLLLGVQGAGKSMCAKAIATAWQRPLLRMDPGSLYDRYIGESERRLRETLRQAELMAPIVLWIDEIEKGFASAASRSTDGGLSQRMFGSLLTWMQDHRAPVFLVATANDIEALPPELLRKGRFDEIFFVDLPAKEVRRDIFSIHIAQRKREPAMFDLDALAEASEGYSGAEIEQAVIASLHRAFAEHTDLSTKLMLETLKASPPLSVTMAERIEDLRDWAKGRCVPAD